MVIHLCVISSCRYTGKFPLRGKYISSKINILYWSQHTQENGINPLKLLVSTLNFNKP